jgi:endo-1,4-beta-mannosidase
MESERYLEGHSLNEPPFFVNENFVIWINEFESYVKSIDHNIWHVISIGAFQPMKVNFENHKTLKQKY